MTTVAIYRNKAEAIAVCGTTSQTSKMGCKSYGLPISACKVGAKLRLIPGSTCANCYADKGAYRQYSYQVLPAQKRRLDSLNRALGDVAAAWQWVDAMVKLIGKDSHFRWHDSGDVQSLRHLELIAQVALEMPQTRFWLPTREKATVLSYLRKHGAFPDNLTVRLSATMIDGEPVRIDGVQNSAVHTTAPIAGAMACIAPSQGGECRECRACWSKSVSCVSYHVH